MAKQADTKTKQQPSGPSTELPVCAQAATGAALEPSAEDKEVNLKTVINMTTGVLKATEYHLIPAARFRTKPDVIKTDVSFNRKGALTKTMFVSLSDELSASSQLALIGPTQVEAEGRVILNVSNVGGEAVKIIPGQVIGKFVVIEGKVETING